MRVSSGGGQPGAHPVACEPEKQKRVRERCAKAQRVGALEEGALGSVGVRFAAPAGIYRTRCLEFGTLIFFEAVIISL